MLISTVVAVRAGAIFIGNLLSQITDVYGGDYEALYLTWNEATSRWFSSISL